MKTYTKDYTKSDINEAISNFATSLVSTVCKGKAKEVTPENSELILRELSKSSMKPFTVVVNRNTTEVTLLSDTNAPTLVIFKEKTLWDITNTLKNNIG